MIRRARTAGGCRRRHVPSRGHRRRVTERRRARSSCARHHLSAQVLGDVDDPGDLAAPAGRSVVAAPQATNRCSLLPRPGPRRASPAPGSSNAARSRSTSLAPAATTMSTLSDAISRIGVGMMVRRVRMTAPYERAATTESGRRGWSAASNGARRSQSVTGWASGASSTSP
jgi:hypothetical protein